MPHQCVHCSHIYEKAGDFLVKGCKKCGGHFFFYIRESQLEKLKEKPIELKEKEKEKVEKDIREMANVEDEKVPIILDIESVRVLGEGKYEIDVVSLFNRKKPIVYKLEEGKYIIDLLR